MRNLKRMLCLVLSVVMLVGMMMIGAGAAGIDGFGDKAEIEHKDAVALLVELGVINGNNDGNFYPSDRLTREQMAKIAYLVMNVNQDYSIYEGTATALTDVANRWSTGAIAWCNSAGIIAGGNDGSFSPDGTLTVAQAQTFLLRTLGYDNKVSGLTGTGWDVNAGILATERGLMKGLSGLKSSDFITRDQVCQMAFNAIFTKGVVVEKTFNFMTGEMVATGYKTDNLGNYTGTTKAESVFGLTKINGTAGAVNNKGEITVSYKDAEGADKTLKVTGDENMAGANVTVYTRNGEVVGAATTNNSTVIATIGGKDYDSKVGNNKTYIPDNPTFYVNGSIGSRSDIVAGSIVELVNTDADAKIEVVRITNKTVATVGADPVVKDKKVTVAGVVADASVNAVKGYEDLKKGDVVLYHAAAGVTYIEKANVTTGTVSSVTKDGVYTVGNEKLVKSGLTNASVIASPSFKDEYNFYLDNYNNIVAMAVAGEAPVVEETKYAVVLDFGYKGTQGTEIGAKDNVAWQVKLLFPETNTQEIVTMKAIVTGEADGKPTTVELTASAEGVGDLNDAYQYTLVSYTVKDNEYTLNKVTTADDSKTFDSIEGGKAVFEDDFIANSKTIFLIGTGYDKTADAGKEYAKVKFAAYTGYANAPTINGASSSDKGEITKKGIINDESGIATLVYVIADKVDGVEVKTNAYIISANYTETADGFVYDAVVNGEVTTLTADKHTYFTAEGFYEYTADADGVVVGATLEGGIKTGITAAGNGIITVADKTYTYDDATKIYSIKNGKAELIGVDKLGAGENNMSRVIIVNVANEDELIDYMYVLPATGMKKTSTTELNNLLGDTADIPDTVKLNEGASFKTEGKTITVTGEVAYSEGFEWFNPSKTDEQEGSFIALILTAPNDGMKWELLKGAGNSASAYKNGTLDAGDPELLVILQLGSTAANNKWTVKFSKDGEQPITYTIDASKATCGAKAETTPAA